MAKNKDVSEKMARAKKLIEQKKYDDARAILITIDHPTADKWLERLNSISPSKETVVIQANKSGGCLRTIGAAVVTLFICVIVIMFIPQNSGDSSSGGDSNAPSNSRSNPFAANTLQNVRDGRFQVNTFNRNMTNAVEDMSPANKNPEAGQEWVLVNATFHCDLSADGVCTTSLMQFELVGDKGQAYNTQFITILDNPFGGEVFGGGSRTGDIGFIVDSDDGNWILVIVDRGRTFFALP